MPRTPVGVAQVSDGSSETASPSPPLPDRDTGARKGEKTPQDPWSARWSSVQPESLRLDPGGPVQPPRRPGPTLPLWASVSSLLPRGQQQAPGGPSGAGWERHATPSRSSEGRLPSGHLTPAPAGLPARPAVHVLPGPAPGPGCAWRPRRPQSTSPHSQFRPPAEGDLPGPRSLGRALAPRPAHYCRGGRGHKLEKGQPGLRAPLHGEGVEGGGRGLCPAVPILPPLTVAAPGSPGSPQHRAPPDLTVASRTSAHSAAHVVWKGLGHTSANPV